MSEYDWLIKPCESDDPKYPYAARGVKPFAGGRFVEMGYGHSERGAVDDVKRRCAEHDRRASDDDAPPQRQSNPLVSTWGPAKGSRWHEGM